MKGRPSTIHVCLKLALCIALLVATIYAYIQKQNELTALKLMIPLTAKELRELQEDIAYLEYAIHSFENPTSLITISNSPQYGHLHYPQEDDVLVLPSQPPLQE